MREIRDYVDALARRERRLTAWSSLLRLAMLVAVAAGWMVVAARLDVPRATAAVVLVSWLGLGSWWAVARPLLIVWPELADPRRQARLVESRQPKLRGRLMASVDRPDQVIGKESPAILALMARRAQLALRGHGPAEVHPAGPVRRLAGGAGASWLVAALLLALAPGGGQGVWGWWLGGTSASAAMALTDVELAEAAARVGDISLRYVYPDYTGLEPYVVANSTGEAHAPPGTRVHVVAKTEGQVSTAALVAYDEPALDATVMDARTIEASFVVQAIEGTYALITHVGDEARRSREFPIIPEPDLPPEVSIVDAAAVIEVPVDQRLGLRWTARDDYGLARVVLELDGQETSPTLRKPRERRAELSDVIYERPVDLGMVAGRTYDLTVAAWDNDTWSGSKAGRSQVVRVVVLGEDGVARMTNERRRELLDLLVDVLADHLEEPYPPGTTSGDFARWGETVSTRYDELSAFLEAFRGRRGTLAADLRTSELALDAARTMIRYTQVSFVPGSTDSAHEASVQAVADMRVEAIATVEEAVLDVDRLISNAALREVLSSLNLMSEEGKELERRASADQVDTLELSISLDGLREMFARMEQLASDLRDGGMKKLVEDRSGEIDRLMEATSDAIAEGDKERAQQLAQRLAERLGEMADAIREEVERRSEQGQQGQSAAQDLVEELKAIADAQEDLADALSEQASSAGEARISELRGAWEEVARVAEQVEGRLQAHADALVEADRIFNEQELVSWALSEVNDTRRSIDARDLSGAIMAASELARVWQNYVDRYDTIFARLARQSGGPDARAIRARQEDIAVLEDRLEALRREDSKGDPEIQALARQQREQQQRLSERLEQASRDAKRVAQEFSVTPRGMEQSLEDAQRRMGQAEQELGSGEALQAEGSQRAGTQHVRRAIETLEQAMQSAQRQQDEMQDSGDSGGEERPDQGEEDGEPTGRFDLPEPEEFMTPEEYRRALLEGMEGQVPEEFRSMKRRYFEELVHQ